MRKMLSCFFATLAISVPALLQACPMCQGGASGGSILAYRGTTILLVLLPFITGWLIYRFIKQESTITEIPAD